MENYAPVRAGMSDLMHAARTEALRIMSETKGDHVREHELVLQRLVAADVIGGGDAESLLGLYKIGYEAGQGKGDPRRAFFASRDIYNKIAASPQPNPVSLIIASAAIGSFDLSEGPDGSIVVTVYALSYGQQGAAIGAGIGTLLGGAVGGMLGGEIGGLIGGIFDSKGKGKGKGGNT